jgi:CHASE3 domain sensor protein
MQLFITAIKEHYRFGSASGSLTVEDLWDLPLQGKKTCLDEIAKGIARSLKATEEESFVNTAKGSDPVLQNKLEIVKYVIKAKLEEADQARVATERKAKRQQIMQLIHDKKNEALASKSVEELETLLADL